MFEGTMSVNIVRTLLPHGCIHMGPEKLSHIMKTMSDICFEIFCYVTSLYVVSIVYLFLRKQNITKKQTKRGQIREPRMTRKLNSLAQSLAILLYPMELKLVAQ